MDKHLIASQYDAIASNIQTLSDDTQYLKRQSDLIGSLSDTHEFRKPLTNRIKSVQSLVMKIKSKLSKAEDEGLFKYGKWRKLKQDFLHHFERLNKISSVIRTKLKQNRMRASISEQSDNDQLLTTKNRGYGTASSHKQQEQECEQIMFEEYTGIYEMENFEEEVYKIVDNLQELYQAQRDLNDLVYEMDEPIQILVDNTGDALENVQSGVVNIEKASKHLKSYRGKMCIVMAVLLIIAIIVTVIIVTSTK